MTEEHKKNIGLANKGKKKTITDKWREAHRKARTGTKHSEATKQKMRETALRLGRTVPFRPKGFVMSLESRKKLSETRINKGLASGSNNTNWRGGITAINRVIRKSFEYKLWRDSVLRRDKYTCIWCGLIGGWSKEQKRKINLEVDHIKPFASYPELRFAIDNGRTLCKECHITTDTYGRNKNVQRIS